MRLLLNLFALLVTIPQGISQTFLSFEPLAPPMIEWDQTNTTFYTGQTIQMNWTSQGFATTDLARIQYTGAGGTRTLTTGSGTPIQTGSYSLRLSDSSNGVATNQPLTIALASNTAINLQSTQRITVIQSKLMNIGLLNNNIAVVSGATLLCDNGNVTITWRGLGQAQFGLASISIRSGGGTLVGTALSNIPVVANMSVDYVLPRTFTPNTGSTYTAQISVQETGQSAYTGASVGFRLNAAPSVSPTSSTTPTASRTPSNTPSNTPSPSATPSPTSSPSITSSPTPSITSTTSPTPSTTNSAAPSLDLAAIARAAAEGVDTQTPALAGALGGIGGLLVLLGVGKWYQNKVMTERRKKKLAMTSRFVRDAQSIYGIAPSSGANNEETSQPSIVMYTVAGLPPKNTLTTSKKQLETYKKTFPPKTTNDSTQ